MAGNRGGALLRLPGQPAGNKCPPHPHAAKQLEPELALPRSSCLQAAMDRRLQLLARATAAVDCRGGPGRMRAVTCLTCGATFASRTILQVTSCPNAPKISPSSASSTIGTIAFMFRLPSHMYDSPL